MLQAPSIFSILMLLRWWNTFCTTIKKLGFCLLFHVVSTQTMDNIYPRAHDQLEKHNLQDQIPLALSTLVCISRDGAKEFCSVQENLLQHCKGTVGDPKGSWFRHTEETKHCVLWKRPGSPHVFSEIMEIPCGHVRVDFGPLCWENSSDDFSINRTMMWSPKNVLRQARMNKWSIIYWRLLWKKLLHGKDNDGCSELEIL